MASRLAYSDAVAESAIALCHRRAMLQKASQPGAAQGEQAIEIVQTLQISKNHRVVVAGRQKYPAIWAEIEAVDGAVVAPQKAHLFSVSPRHPYTQTAWKNR